MTTSTAKPASTNKLKIPTHGDKDAPVASADYVSFLLIKIHDLEKENAELREIINTPVPRDGEPTLSGNLRIDN